MLCEGCSKDVHSFDSPSYSSHFRSFRKRIMARYKEYSSLTGSERVKPTEAQAKGAANPEETLRVTVLLRSRAGGEGPAKEKPSSAGAERRLSREEFVNTFGAIPEDLGKIEEFAHEYNLTIVEKSLAKRSVVLTGTVANFSKAFQVELQQYEGSGLSFRGRSGAVKIPAELNDVVKAVMGLDNRPQAQPHLRRRPIPDATHSRTGQEPGTFTPPQVAQIYGFPQNADGSGQTIGILELGGGFVSADMEYYFRNILKMDVPKIVSVSVDGAGNTPCGSFMGPDSEVLLDIQVAGAIAPKATLVVYFTLNNDQGFYNGLAAAVHDAQNDPGVISVSWGSSESTWSQQFVTQFNKLLQDAATLGVTVCCSTGDNGSTDGRSDGLQHVEYPATSPFALACGGTSLTAPNNQYSKEVVWNDMDKHQGATGGGVSEIFPKPAFQAEAGVPPSKNPSRFVGRGVPDVAGNADPHTGYVVYGDGTPGTLAGTSAVAPLWAALISLINQINGKRLGYITPLLYAPNAREALFHNVTEGNNGAYSAGPGWDPCTGLGSPKGEAIVSMFRAGRPQAQAAER